MALQPIARKPAKVNMWTEHCMRVYSVAKKIVSINLQPPWTSRSLLVETANDTWTNRRRNHIPPWSLDSCIFVTNEERRLQIQFSIWFYVKTVITFCSIQHLSYRIPFGVSRVQADRKEKNNFSRFPQDFRSNFRQMSDRLFYWNFPSFRDYNNNTCVEKS